MTDKNGWTPVHCASYHGRLGCLQMLIKWGAEVDHTDNCGNTPGLYIHLVVWLRFAVTSEYIVK